MTDERSEREQESATNFTKIQREVAKRPGATQGNQLEIAMSAIQAYHQRLIDEGYVVIPKELFDLPPTAKESAAALFAKHQPSLADKYAIVPREPTGAMYNIAGSQASLYPSQFKILYKAILQSNEQEDRDDG